MTKHHTGYTNSVNQKSNNKWVPSMWDRNGSQWTSIVRCGSWGPAIYGELCHQGACRPQGWAGSRRQLRRLIERRADGTCGYSPNQGIFNKAIDRMVSAGLLIMEPALAQQTTFKLVPPPDTPEAEDKENRMSHTADALEAMKIWEKEEGGELYDVWRLRVVFPMPSFVLLKKNH